MPEMPNEAPPPSSKQHPDQQQQQHQPAAATTAAAPYQGVLWKRRDVFKRRWNPHWFVLEPSKGVMTYYRLHSSSLEAAVAASPKSSHDTPRSQTPTPQDHHKMNARALAVTPTSSPVRTAAAVARTALLRPVAQLKAAAFGPGVSPLRKRSNSWDSSDSDKSLDHHDDAVPRGTIPIRGCTIFRNNPPSKPEEGYFVLTIQSSPLSSPSPSSSSSSAKSQQLQLAARS